MQRPRGDQLESGALINQVARALTTALDRRFAVQRLTSQQAAALLHVAGGVHSPRDLGAALGTDTAGTTRLLDRLEDKGLLRRTRHPDDRRAVLAELTADGRAVVPALPPVFGSVVGTLLAGFTPAEVEQLIAALRRMLANLAS
jgi:DNA-binding MarR family transcriptional regulator